MSGEAIDTRTRLRIGVLRHSSCAVWVVDIWNADPQALCSGTASRRAEHSQSAMAFIRSAILIVAKLEKVSDTA